VLLRARTSQPDRLRAWAHKLAQTHVHNKVGRAPSSGGVWGVRGDAQVLQLPDSVLADRSQ
jgi:hypothetical protein